MQASYKKKKERKPRPPNVSKKEAGFDCRGGLGIFLFTIMSITALEPTQPPIQWVPGTLSLGLKRPCVNLTTHLHLVPSLKNDWSSTSTPQYAFMAWCLVKKKKHRDNSNFLPFIQNIFLQTLVL